MPKPVPVRPTNADIARDRFHRLGLLAFALKTHTDNVRHMLIPPEPTTFRETTTRLYLYLTQFPAHQRIFWRREWDGFVRDWHRVVSRSRTTE